MQAQVEAWEHEVRMRMRPMLKTQGAGGVFVFVRPAFALATVDGGKANRGTKTVTAPQPVTARRRAKKRQPVD